VKVEKKMTLTPTHPNTNETTALFELQGAQVNGDRAKRTK
jgi:hypothetical protein